MSCVAAAGLAASCWRNGRPGTAGAGAGGAGSAAAGALSASAAEIAPAAAIIVVANIFLVLNMVLPIRLKARLRPKLVCYWCYSSDTCGGYSTVTDATAYGDPSLESSGLTGISLGASLGL